MGHCIQAVIGTHESIRTLTDNWDSAREIVLPQGYGMVFLTSSLFDDITAFFDVLDEERDLGLDYFTVAIEQFLRRYSLHTKLVYCETDYSGGMGTQAGVFFENGKISIEPCSGEGTINRLLKELGVRCEAGMDAFDSLNLGQYRHMPE